MKQTGNSLNDTAQPFVPQATTVKKEASEQRLSESVVDEKADDADKKKKKKVKQRAKKKFDGPQNNQIVIDALLRDSVTWMNGNYQPPAQGDNLMRQTTLMLKNIPVKFTQKTMLELIDERFSGAYDYFYLPMDLKTQGSVGFAFINFVHPACIMRFFREFQGAHWSGLVDGCKSTK